MRRSGKLGDSLPCIKPEELTVLTDEWRIYAETDIPEEWAQKDGSAVRVDQYWSKVLKLKSVSGSQKFSVLGTVIKCALSLSNGNADNERNLSINKNTLSKERSSLSFTALNGLRAVADGVRNKGGLSNVAVNKGMLVSVTCQSILFYIFKFTKDITLSMILLYFFVIIQVIHCSSIKHSFK